jgi:MFS family permease
VGGLYLIWAAIGLSMSATLYDPAFATATRWFERRRVRALTLITLLAGFASTIFIPLAGWLVQVQGWRTSLVTLAAILAIGTIAPHALLLRNRPEDLGLQPDGWPPSQSARSGDKPSQPAQGVDRPSQPAQGVESGGAIAAVPGPPSPGQGVDKPSQPAQGVDKGGAIAAVAGPPWAGVTVGEALRHASFRWLALAFCLATLCTIATGVHLLPYLEDRGYDLTFAAGLTGLVGAMQVAARLVLAPFSSRANPRVLAACVFALQPLALAVLLQFPIAIAQAAAPVGAGAAYDVLRSYEPIFWTLAALSAIAVVAILPARSTRVQALQSHS